MENIVYFHNDGNMHRNCLKVFNENGDELSLAGDDSCGAFKHMSRTSLAVFPNGGHKMEGEEITFVSPVELLEALAKHMGYTIHKEVR